jgi:predicted ester cyclase
MSLEENKALVQAYFDNVWNKVNQEPGYRYWVKEGADYDHNIWIPMWRRALSDMHMSVDAMYAEGNCVTVCMTLHGTHTGVLEGELVQQGIISQPLPPTGSKIEFSAIIVFEINDGIITRPVHGVIDWLTGLRQLGALPMPA